MEAIRTKAVQKIMGSDTTYFFVDNKNFYVRCENKESRDKFEKYLKENLPQYTLWREETGNKNWVLYRNDMFEVLDEAYLHFKGGKEVELPINCSGCYLMFNYCKLPEGFSLGDKFDTRNVNNMNSMFWNCEFPIGFSLGDKFDTSNVKDMSEMFLDCKLPEGFSLGDKFDTRNVEDMSYMFKNCKLPEGFSLGDKFDTSNVTNMSKMFKNCKLPKDFSFGDLFIIDDDTNTFNMFKDCEISEGVALPKKSSKKTVQTVQSAIGF